MYLDKLKLAGKNTKITSQNQQFISLFTFVNKSYLANKCEISQVNEIIVNVETSQPCHFLSIHFIAESTQLHFLLPFNSKSDNRKHISLVNILFSLVLGMISFY